MTFKCWVPTCTPTHEVWSKLRHIHIRQRWEAKNNIGYSSSWSDLTHLKSIVNSSHSWNRIRYDEFKNSRKGKASMMQEIPSSIVGISYPTPTFRETPDRSRWLIPKDKPSTHTPSRTETPPSPKIILAFYPKSTIYIRMDSTNVQVWLAGIIVVLDALLPFVFFLFAFKGKSYA